MRHYLLVVLLGSVMLTGCAAKPNDPAIYSVVEKALPEVVISNQEYSWADNKSYASNLIEISGGQYGLFDSFGAENAHVEATTAGRVGWAAFNWLSGSNVLETASLDSVRAKNSKDAEFNPFIMLFIDEVELNEGLANKNSVEFMQEKITSQLQKAFDEFYTNTNVKLYIHNAAINDYIRKANTPYRQAEDTTFLVVVSGDACTDVRDNGYLRHSNLEADAKPHPSGHVFFFEGLPSEVDCRVFVSVKSLGYQQLPWNGAGSKTHAFKIETSQRSLSTSLAAWVPSLSASSHLTWVVGNRWYSGTKYMRSQFPFVTGGGHAWLFTVGNDSIPLDDFQKMTGQTE